MKTSYGIIILIVVIVLLAGAIYWLGNIGAGPETAENIALITNKEATNTSITDLNTTTESEVLVDPNPQGTVETNYTTVSVAADNRGRLAFYVTDPANVNLPEQAQADKNNNKNENENANGNLNQERDQDQNQNQNMNQNTNQLIISPSANANKDKGNKVELASLVLTFSKVQVHLAQADWMINNTNINTNTADVNSNLNANANTNTDNKLAEGEGRDKWEVLNIDTSKEYDLIAMKNAGGSLSLLGITDLAAGKYTQIRMYVASAKAKTVDGEDITIEIPGQNNIIKIVRNFTVEAGETTELTVDFDAISSVTKANDRYLLRPVVGKMLVNGQEVD